MTMRETYGPWAVIAGGSEGVGAAFARLLAEAGINLALVARKPSPLAALKHELRNKVQVRTLTIDLIRPDAIDQIIQATDDIEVGLLICNAGAAADARDFLDKPLADALNTTELNVGGPLALCHHFAQAMRARRRGGILLVSSMAGFAGNPGFIAYAGAKAFMRIFAEGLWYELKPAGVHVLCLVLSATDTPAMARAGMNAGAMPLDDPAAVAAEGLAHLAQGPVHVVKSAAEAAAYLASGPRAEVVAGFAQSVKALFGRS